MKLKFFLRIKHWQLFGLLMGIPFIVQFFVNIVIGSQDPTKMFLVFFPVTILFMGVFMGWFYALGVNLSTKLPDTVKMNLTKFKLFLIIPIVYIVVISIFKSGIFGNTFDNVKSGSSMFLLSLFCMFCIFYCLYFNAKSLKAVELQKPVTFSDYAGEFFLIWFFPFGLWIIQPRINKLFEKK